MVRSVHSLMGCGSEFQREGAATEKALSPQVRCLMRVGMDKRLGRGVVVQQVCEVGGDLIVEGFVRYEQDFEVDSLTDGEPVEVLEDGSDVVSGAGVGEGRAAEFWICWSLLRRLDGIP